MPAPLLATQVNVAVLLVTSATDSDSSPLEQVPILPLWLQSRAKPEGCTDPSLWK